MRFLLDQEANTPSLINKVVPQLCHACRGGNYDVAAPLLGQDVDHLAAGSPGRIALHDAAEGSHGAALKLLLEQDPLQLS
jgi:hypothetical protein